LRIGYAKEFRDKHIKQLQFMQFLAEAEPHPLSNLFLMNTIQCVKLKDEHPLSQEGKDTRENLKAKSINAYDSTGEAAGIAEGYEMLWYPVQQMMCSPKVMICARIIPFAIRTDANYIFEAPMHLDIANQPENTLMVHTVVEEAMDLGRIAFAPVGEASTDEITEFRLVIIDPSILKEKTLEWKVSSSSCVLGTM
jgi:hypothetical protein